MSRILDLGKNYTKLPEVMEEYESALSTAEEKLAIKGKNLEVANRENPAWLHYYDQRRSELKTLNNYFEGQLKRIRGKQFRSLNDKSSIELTDRAKDKYIDEDPAYLSMFEVFLEVHEMYDKYIAVVTAFQARGYALNNITKIRVASLEDAEIY